MTYTMREFDVEDSAQCERLADMFNDWDSSWPGGFTRGVKETATTVQSEFRRTRHLARLVVEYEDAYVGFCSLEAQPGQMELAYIGLLGARLSAHGKGVGKMLLREMVRRVVELGYKQVTLHTWAGNTKAVPLYKKMGFQWVPETDVFMRNFLPAILNMPLTKKFLNGRDWYECHDREIVVAQDDVTWRGMKVYAYCFRNGDRTLKLTFDAAGEGLTHLETEEIAVSCVVGMEEAPAGQTYPVTWEIASKTGRPLDVVLLSEAEAGLNLSVQERLQVTDTAHITRSLRIDADAMPRAENMAAHRIKTTFLIDGQPITLETGVKIMRPVEMEISEQRLLPGRPEQITVSLRSRLDRELSGTLALNACPGLHIAAFSQAFTLPAKGRTQCAFTVTAERAGALNTSFVLAADDLKVERPTAFRVLDANGVVGSMDAWDEKATLQSLDTRVTVHLRGGNFYVQYGREYQTLVDVGAGEVGPPFVFERLTPALFTGHIERGVKDDLLTTSGQAEHKPGLRLERTLTLLGGGVTRCEYRVVNATDVDVPAKVRLNCWSNREGKLAAPFADGILYEQIQDLRGFPEGETDVLAEGAKLKENWIAAEGEGMVAGLVFAGDPEQDRQWTRLVNLTYDLESVPAHGVSELPPVYVIACPGDWQTVRNWWRLLVQPSGVEETAPPRTMRVLEMEIKPALLTQKTQIVGLTVTNRRAKELSGSLTLAGDAQITPDTLELSGVNRDKPFRRSVQITTPNRPHARLITAHINSVPVADTRKIGIVRLGGAGSVQITQPEDGLIDLDNGYLSFRVAPAFQGAMITLEREGVNHLRSAYPTPRPFVWANPWFGGVHPFLRWMVNSKLARETWTGEPIARTGETGIAWQGVRVLCQPAHKDRNWLRVEAEYLTTPGSNVLALALRCVNLSNARLSTPGDAGIGAWLQVGGTHTNAVLHGEFDGERQARRRGGFGMDNDAGKWKAVENADTSHTVLMIAASAGLQAGVKDFAEEGAHLSARGEMILQPNETKETLSWLVLSPDTSEIDAYVAALGECRTLP